MITLQRNEGLCLRGCTITLMTTRAAPSHRTLRIRVHLAKLRRVVYLSLVSLLILQNGSEKWYTLVARHQSLPVFGLMVLYIEP